MYKASISACRVGAHTLRTVANFLSWIGTLRDNWQVLQFSGNGRFDHEADTREAALVLVLSRPEEGEV